MMSLTISQEEELQHMLDEISAYRSKLKPKERDFTDDMTKRFEEYGSDMFVSDKQLKWLRDIHRRVAE